MSLSPFGLIDDEAYDRMEALGEAREEARKLGELSPADAAYWAALRCPKCEAEEIKRFGKVYRFTHFGCSDCGHIFSHEEELIAL